MCPYRIELKIRKTFIKNNKAATCKVPGDVTKFKLTSMRLVTLELTSVLLTASSTPAKINELILIIINTSYKPNSYIFADVRIWFI